MDGMITIYTLLNRDTLDEMEMWMTAEEDMMFEIGEILEGWCGADHEVLDINYMPEEDFYERYGIQ